MSFDSGFFATLSPRVLVGMQECGWFAGRTISKLRLEWWAYRYSKYKLALTEPCREILSEFGALKIGSQHCYLTIGPSPELLQNNFPNLAENIETFFNVTEEQLSPIGAFGGNTFYLVSPSRRLFKLDWRDQDEGILATVNSGLTVCENLGEIFTEVFRIADTYERSYRNYFLE